MAVEFRGRGRRVIRARGTVAHISRQINATEFGADPGKVLGNQRLRLVYCKDGKTSYLGLSDALRDLASRAVYDKAMDASAAGASATDSRATDSRAAGGPPRRLVQLELVLVDATNRVVVVDRARLAASPTLLGDPQLFLRRSAALVSVSESIPTVISFATGDAAVGILAPVHVAVRFESPIHKTQPLQDDGANEATAELLQEVFGISSAPSVDHLPTRHGARPASGAFERYLAVCAAAHFQCVQRAAAKEIKDLEENRPALVASIR